MAKPIRSSIYWLPPVYPFLSLISLQGDLLDVPVTHGHVLSELSFAMFALLSGHHHLLFKVLSRSASEDSQTHSVVKPGNVLIWRQGDQLALLGESTQFTISYSRNSRVGLTGA